jgi:hypothetical protein
MARHVWTVLCRKASIDANSGATSLFEVLEGIRLNQLVMKGVKRAVVPVQMQLVVTCVRSAADVSETVRGRSILVLPSGTKAMGNSFDIDLSDSFGSQSVLDITGIPIDKSGIYEFLIEIEDQEKGKWHTVSRTPLMVELTKPVTSSAKDSALARES